LLDSIAPRRLTVDEPSGKDVITGDLLQDDDPVAQYRTDEPVAPSLESREQVGQTGKLQRGLLSIVAHLTEV
jgi:hypothetical protein